MERHKVKFQTYVDGRNFLNIGDCIDLIYEGRNGMMEASLAVIVKIIEIRRVHKSDCTSVVGFAQYLTKNESKNCVLKYHAREFC